MFWAVTRPVCVATTDLGVSRPLITCLSLSRSVDDAGPVQVGVGLGVAVGDGEGDPVGEADAVGEARETALGCRAGLPSAGEPRVSMRTTPVPAAATTSSRAAPASRRRRRSCRCRTSWARYLT